MIENIQKCSTCGIENPNSKYCPIRGVGVISWCSPCKPKKCINCPNQYQTKLWECKEDGELHDMTLTKDLIVNSASEMPMSIIIIGVGNEKFKMMKELDSDSSMLTGSDGNQAPRDIM